MPGWAPFDGIVPRRSVDAGSFAQAAERGKTEFKAKVTRIAGAIDRKNGTLRAEIDLPNPQGTILPGMFANVTLKFEK